MGGDMFNGLFTALVGFGVIVTLVVGIIVWGIVIFISDDEIKTKKPIQYDRMELVIDNNKIDTLYVYDLSKY